MTDKLGIGDVFYEFKDNIPLRKLFVSKITKTTAYSGIQKFQPFTTNGKLDPQFDSATTFHLETPTNKALFMEAKAKRNRQ